jgi:hypothetical protein
MPALQLGLCLASSGAISGAIAVRPNGERLRVRWVGRVFAHADPGHCGTCDVFQQVYDSAVSGSLR